MQDKVHYPWISVKGKGLKPPSPLMREGYKILERAVEKMKIYFFSMEQI